jgi:hypothetical protein
VTTAASKVKLASVLLAASITLASAQQTISLGDFDGRVSSKAFTSVPAARIKTGAALSANFVIGSGTKQIWSIEDHDFLVGARIVTYPAMGIVDCSETDPVGNFSVIASTTTFATDIKGGEVFHSGGYAIKASRPIKAGEQIPTLLLVGGGEFSIVSMEQDQNPESKNGDTEPRPWLTIFKETYKPANQAFALEAWNITNKYVSTLAMMKSIR